MPSRSPEFRPLATGQSEPGTQLGTALPCEFPGRPLPWVVARKQGHLGSVSGAGKIERRREFSEY